MTSESLPTNFVVSRGAIPPDVWRVMGRQAQNLGGILTPCAVELADIMPEIDRASDVPAHQEDFDLAAERLGQAQGTGRRAYEGAIRLGLYQQQPLRYSYGAGLPRLEAFGSPNASTWDEFLRKGLSARSLFIFTTFFKRSLEGTEESSVPREELYKKLGKQVGAAKFAVWREVAASFRDVLTEDTDEKT